MLSKRKRMEIRNEEEKRLETEANEDIVMYLLSYEIYQLIRKIDFNYKEALEAKTTSMIGDIYRALNMVADNNTKIRRIFEIFDEYNIHVGEIDICMERGENKGDA